jgi:LppP/LprE lipoprotein
MWISVFRFNALYGDCGGGDGRDQHVWFFVGKRLVGTDAPNSSHEVIGLWRDDTTMAFLYVLYRPSDPECCPTGGGTIVRFRWNGKRVVRLDPLPPRAFAPGIAKGR